MMDSLLPTIVELLYIAIFSIIILFIFLTLCAIIVKLTYDNIKTEYINTIVTIKRSLGAINEELGEIKLNTAKKK